MTKYYSMNIKDVETDLNSDFNNGLTSEEVSKRQEEYGYNILKEKKGKSVIKMIIEQFSSFIILILIAASILSIAIDEVVDGIVIIGIVILNAILGIVQERKASNALNALKEMASPKAKVIREGKLSSIDSKELVPGDIVMLEAGDYVPADIRLVKSVNLRIDESALTGESLAVEKDADNIIEIKTQIADRINSAYMSTIVTYGRGRGIVVGTSMNTEIGKIASMLNEAISEETPLQKKLDAFGKMLGIACIGVCVIIFILGLLRELPTIDVLMTSISLAVAAIPEGLPAVVTVVLAMGMQRMIKRHAIMKELGAVETLGSTTVICTDKTGTLTQNKITVVKVFDGVNHWDVSGTGYTVEGDIVCEGKDKNLLDKLLMSGVLCNDSKLKDEDIIGDPTEGALIVLGEKAGYNKDELNNKYPRLKEFPFDSDRKLMSTLHKVNDDHIIFTKGAPDVILSRCTNIIRDGNTEKLTDKYISNIHQVNKNFAENALRVLGFAFKEVDSDVDINEEENNLTFVGLVGMIDPPREEAKKAVELCKDAGIRVLMITGDHVITGSAIARQIGIIDEDSEAMEGKYIDDYSIDELREKVKKTSVFARVSPEHKVKIVDSIRSSGEIVAMTGDGVNDAPALKKADIGIAMGITGTDVSKEAADMILTDDNFASIVDAVEEGRIIYSNIRKFVGFLLSCNIGEILIIFISMILGWQVPLVPIQLLWINLITDSFPAFALGLEKGEKGIMKMKPRNANEPIVDYRMKIALIFQSIGLTVAVLVSYQLGFVMANELDYTTKLTISRTLCFITLIIGEMLRAYSARSETVSIFRMNFLGNKYLNYSVLIAIILLGAVVYIPVLQPIFDTYPINAVQILIAVGLAIIPVITGELAKILKN